MTLPETLPADRFNLTLDLDGGRRRDGTGWGGYLEDPAQPFAVVVHTTETPGSASYLRDFGPPDGVVSVAPHVEALPLWPPTPHPILWIQRNRFQYRAGSLAGRSSSGGPTNEAKALQLELIAYSSRSIAAGHPSRHWVGDLLEEHLRELARGLAWFTEAFGVPPVWRPKNTVTRTDEMTWNEWWYKRAEYGWGYSDHAENPDASGHWDAGALDWTRIMPHVRSFLSPPIPGPPDEEDTVTTKLPTLRRVWPENPNPNESVKVAQALLHNAGVIDPGAANFKNGWDGKFGPSVEQAVRRFQGLEVLEIDGVIGEATWARLLRVS